MATSNVTTTIRSVMVTGASGFVGRYVVRQLLARGLTPVCVVRSTARLHRQLPTVPTERIATVVGDLSDPGALREAAAASQAAIHLVGIILARRLKGQTFEKVHHRGTRNVVDAVRSAGIKRYLHMSALGTRPDAESKYHRTKWAAERFVRGSGLDWTIFRPSLIHGPDGEFMRLMKRFACGVVPPVMPYFGSGSAKVQPVSVKDVAHCFVEALNRGDTVQREIPLGGPRSYSWVEMYQLCRRSIPGARSWKPMVSMPVFAARLAALLSLPLAVVELLIPSLGLFRFDAGQVQMSQEDSVCDYTVAETLFGMSMRGFEEELVDYADQIP